MQPSSSKGSSSQTLKHHNGGGDDDRNRGGNSALDLNDIDLESLRLVFGSSSSEDLSHYKAHELRELWYRKAAEASANAKTPAERKISPAKLPRFLLDPKEEDHLAPHAVCLQLLLGQRRSSLTGDGLYKPVRCSSDDDDCDEPRSRNRPDTHSSRRNSKDTNKTLQGSVMVWPLILVALLVVLCQFVLEVLGGAGAIWGTAELFALRKGGTGHPSWRLFTIWAHIVGACCLLRFLLVHPFFARATDPTFAEKHKLRNLLRRYQPERSGFFDRIGFFFDLVLLVARDPVLFLHPTKGLALSSICGCYCVCCGSQWSSFVGDGNDNDSDNIEFDEHYGSCSRSPVSSSSLEKSSNQRSTWDMSDDEDADEYGTAVGP